MGEVSKSPEEIKKGLLVHAHTICDDLCPYYAFKEGGVPCSNELCGDALSYIEQLEQIAIHWQSSMDQVKKALRDNGFGSLEEFLQAYSQVKRERDAALHDMKNINGNICLSCKNHYRPDLSVLKFACKEFGDLRCQEVLHCGKFEWRGVQEKEEVAE